MFQNTTHAKEFSKMDAVKTLIEYVTLPCIPYDFSSMQQSYGLGVIFRALIEVNPVTTAALLTDCFERIYTRLAPFLSHSTADGLLGSFVDVTGLIRLELIRKLRTRC
jgi:hypothetical protein